MQNGYICINNTVFPTLFALSEEEQQRGLMHQAWPPPIMSFYYDYPKINKFWMKNTPSPLDIVFCHNGKVSQIHQGIPYSTDMIGDNNFSDLIVEFPYGTVNVAGIKIGHPVSVVTPTTNELKKIFAKKSVIL